MIIVLTKKLEDVKVPYNLSKTKHYEWNSKRRYK